MNQHSQLHHVQTNKRRHYMHCSGRNINSIYNHLSTVEDKCLVTYCLATQKFSITTNHKEKP